MKGSWVFRFLFIFMLVFPFVITGAVSHAIDNEECLECHGDPDFVKELPGGKTISLYVDGKRFAQSVHGQNDVACTDCHAGITELDYDKDVPHPAPTQPVDCSSCHEEEQEVYEKSVHGQARKDGDEEAPTCATCHNNYHYVRYLAGATAADRSKGTCLNCHDPSEYHDWLPSAKKTHYKYTDCSVCHAKKSPKITRLLFYNIFKEQVIPGEKIIKALSADFDNFLEVADKNGNGRIDAKELYLITKTLKSKGIRASVVGEIVADMDPSIHAITKDAIKECSQCHSTKSPILSNLFLTLTKSDGGAENYPLSKEVLSSIYPIRFYLIEGTRIKLIDIIGVLIVLGGIGFAGGHLTVRLLTIPLRRREKK